MRKLLTFILSFVLLVSISTAAFAEDAFLGRYFSHPLTEGSFVGLDNVKIKYGVFKTKNENGAIVIVNGRGESFLNYYELINELLLDGNYSVYVYDHRGQGLSGRMTPNTQMGFVKDFDDYVADLKTFVDDVVKKDPHKKLFLISHSMGGAISALYLQKYPKDFDAAAMSAPMIEIKAKYPLFAVYGLTLFKSLTGSDKNYAPNQKDWIPTPFSVNELTNDEGRYEKSIQIINENPKIRPGGASYGWLKEAIAADRKILNIAADIKTPILLLQAQGDTIVSNDAQNKFCKLAKACREEVLPNSKHEIFLERDPVRKAAITQILNFFLGCHPRAL